MAVSCTQDAVRCIVKMLTDDSSDEAGDTLFEELARTGEHVEVQCCACPSSRFRV